MPSVSIVTISQYSRNNFINILAKCIKKQDYENIIEWIIVDTSCVLENSIGYDLLATVYKFIEDNKLPKIIYYKSEKKTMGAWRNESNRLVSGDIIVCMDDDDYYPPERVSHAVKSLENKKTLIAGCSQMFFYDIHYTKFYQFKDLGENYSTNNCMAYWKEYLLNHHYNELLNDAEETSFTNNFTESMVQLDPYKTVLQFSHSDNISNRKSMIYENYYFDQNNQYIVEKGNTIHNFIQDKDILKDYYAIIKKLYKQTESPYDIVYFAGGQSVIWSPQQNDLGGSEQSIKYLTIEWAKKGKKVAVYGNLSWEGTYQGVDFFDHTKFNFWDKFNILILWRFFGCYPYIMFNLLAQKILVDIHDHISEFYQLLIINKDKISHWMIKSDFQQILIEETIKQKIKNAIIIPNGICINDFSKTIKESRNQFRMCYCSCYTRGLYRILKNIWPTVYKLEPKAELHVYYGMDLVSDNNFKKEMEVLLSQPGIMDHGRQPIEMINREKHISMFNLYYTNTLSEIDCINIRESLVAGCIPIISNINVFKYRDGIHIQWLPDLPDFNNQIAHGLVQVMNDEKIYDELANNYHNSKTITSWEQTADEWLDCMYPKNNNVNGE